MTYSVYQHWDPLKVCIVGRSWPPEFYSWISVPHVRKLFEQIAVETEEDYQLLIKKLTEFGVEVLRPELPLHNFDGKKYITPPMTPRDHIIMIGDKFYTHYDSYDFGHFYHHVKEQKKWHWWCRTFEELDLLPADVREECVMLHEQYLKSNPSLFCYDNIFEHIKKQGNTLTTYFNANCDGGFTTRVGKDLYVGTRSYDQNQSLLKQQFEQEFVNNRIHIINTGGHIDGTFCVVAPGLIVSADFAPGFETTFPGWEVVYAPNSKEGKPPLFRELKEKNEGKWWLPGFEHDQDVIDLVEKHLGHWTGYVEETVFDVNCLMLDQKNIITGSYNKEIFDAYERHGITPHVVPFRHRQFWDGGIHCITSDLHRQGTMQDYFPERNQ